MTASSRFTLIELLVVMAIIAVLTAILLPALSKMLTRSEIKATAAEMTRVRAALDEYYEDHGQYPHADVPANVTWGIVKAALDVYYEANLYTKGDKWVDSWDTEIHYVLRNMKVMLISCGPDLKPGVADFDDDDDASTDEQDEAGWPNTDDIVVR